MGAMGTVSLQSKEGYPEEIPQTDPKAHPTKVIWVCICTVVAPTPPLLAAMPLVCVSQYELVTVPVFKPPKPPMLPPVPATAPVAKELRSVDSFCPKNPPTLALPFAEAREKLSEIVPE